MPETTDVPAKTTKTLGRDFLNRYKLEKTKQ